MARDRRKQEALTAGLPAVTRKYLRYDPEIADRVCELMIEGRSLREICAMPGMPARRAVFYWLRDHEGFRERYEIARLMQVEWWAHEIIEIADDASGDFVINEQGERGVDHEHINRARLKIDARKWLMSKLHPAKYAERAGVDLTVRRDMRDITELTRDELLAIASRGRDSAEDGRGEQPPQVH